jgi:hypothetical protein
MLSTYKVDGQATFVPNSGESPQLSIAREQNETLGEEQEAV